MVVSYQSLKSRTQKGVYAKYVERLDPHVQRVGVKKLVINLVILNGWLLMVK